MLLKTLLWRLTGHANIHALQNTIKLWVGSPKFCIFAKHAFRQFYDVNSVTQINKISFSIPVLPQGVSINLPIFPCMQITQQKNLKLFFGALVLFVAFLAIFFNAIGKNAFFIVLKPLTTILILLFTVFFGIRKNKFYKWVVIALIFCLAGDTLLLKETYFIWGLLAFLMAHLCFGWSFMNLGGFKLYFIPLILLVVFGIGYYWMLYNGLQALKIPVLIYFIVILFMGWQGISVRVWKNELPYTLIFVAVLLFITSDALLAWAKFKAPYRWDGVLILATYWISIFSIGLATTIERKKP